MKTDEELLKTFNVEQKETDLILVEVLEAQTEEENNGRQAEIMVEKIMAISKANPNKTFNFLIDLTKTGSSTYVSPRAKEVYGELARYNVFRKAAIIGRSLVLEVTVNLLLSATGRGDSVKWFGTKEEAFNWLNSPK